MKITSRRRVRLSAAALATAGLAMIASPALAATAAPQHLAPYGQLTCGAGPIEPGTYTSILVTGNCWLTDFGTVVVNGDLRVAHDAKFNAVTAGTLVVDGSFFSGTNSITDIGCNVKSVGPPCTSNSSDVVMGNVYSDNALEMSWHSVTVGGWYDIVGRNQYTDNTDCSQTDPTGTPDYFTFEDGSVGGNFSYDGNRTCWMGLFRTHVGGNVYILHNHTNTTVPGIKFDSPEIATNTIAGSLNCSGNTPPPTFGDSKGKPNKAAKGKFGQCKNL
jgi:hypothetical protein